jgi:hypothetical protein
MHAIAPLCFQNQSAMEEKIINYLKTDRSYNTGLRLYMEHGQSMSLKHTLNRQGETPYNYSLLLEELRKMSGMPMDEFNFHLTAPVNKIEPVAEKAEEIAAGIEKPVTKDEKNEFLKEIPEEIKKAIRIRDEFPFLNNPDCPDELKILVADRITAYHNYVEAHKNLFSAASEKELLKAASTVVENYLDNQEIWDELNHYKQTGQLLGKHNVFSKLNRIKEIQSMATGDLVKLQKSLMNNIARNKQKVKEQPEHDETGSRTERIAEYQIELNEANRLLGIKA